MTRNCCSCHDIQLNKCSFDNQSTIEGHHIPLSRCIPGGGKQLGQLNLTNYLRLMTRENTLWSSSKHRLTSQQATISGDSFCLNSPPLEP